MTLTPSSRQAILMIVGALAFLGVLYFTYKSLPAQLRAQVDRFFGGKTPSLFVALTTTVIVASFFYLMHKVVPRHDRAVNITKAAIAIAAAGCVFYEQHRKSLRRPIAERWKRIVGVTLALAAIGAYFNGFKFGYPKYYHRWDQYHYYMGAKYFPELGYKYLYRCAVVAEHELGTVKATFDKAKGAKYAPTRKIKMREEMLDPDKKVRDLPSEYEEDYGGRNLLVPVEDILAHPKKCTGLFSKPRWEAYKNDVKFFRIVSGKGYWTDMQKDHGFNPPPVWTIAGKFLSDLSPATVLYLQYLASLDILYLIGMFIALWWGFGWRVFAVGAIFWGCQSSAPFYWTGGAFLRQDWLFFTVLSVASKPRPPINNARAALVYAGLLRIFPGLVVIGTLVPFVVHIIRKRRMHRDHAQMLIGGCLAAAVLLPLSIAMTQKDSYQTFYNHTIQTHDKTPLTNHMGLRVIISHKFFDFQKPGIRSAKEQDAWRKSLSKNQKRFIGWAAPLRLPIKLAEGKSSGLMQYVRDNNLVDPFKTWKDMRNERYEKYKGVAYAIIGLSLLAFIAVVWRIKSLWVAQCLGQIFIILLSQLTCYYYSFMILGAPLLKLRKQVELGLFATAAITQIIWMNSYWNDHKYTLLTVASLLWCYILLGLFARGHWTRWLLTLLRIRRPARPDRAPSSEEEDEAEEDPDAELAAG